MQMSFRWFSITSFRTKGVAISLFEWPNWDEQYLLNLQCKYEMGLPVWSNNGRQNGHYVWNSVSGIYVAHLFIYFYGEGGKTTDV